MRLANGLLLLFATIVSQRKSSKFVCISSSIWPKHNAIFSNFLPLSVQSFDFLPLFLFFAINHDEEEIDCKIDVGNDTVY